MASAKGYWYKLHPLDVMTPSSRITTFSKAIPFSAKVKYEITSSLMKYLLWLCCNVISVAANNYNQSDEHYNPHYVSCTETIIRLIQGNRHTVMDILDNIFETLNQQSTVSSPKATVHSLPSFPSLTCMHLIPPHVVVVTPSIPNCPPRSLRLGN